mmetsp:Transcript_12270/g.33191  ORF Transcript_12270/g.33191 Transcript_12270/m.33191 type:complete len:298 (-) Transcript_12270:131-1024(-)
MGKSSAASRKKKKDAATGAVVAKAPRKAPAAKKAPRKPPAAKKAPQKADEEDDGELPGQSLLRRRRAAVLDEYPKFRKILGRMKSMSGTEIRAQNDAMSDSQNSAWIEFLEVYTGVDTLMPGAKDMGDAEMKRRILRMSDAEYEAWGIAWEEFGNLLNGADYDYAEDNKVKKWQSLPKLCMDGAPPAELWDYQVSRLHDYGSHFDLKTAISMTSSLYGPRPQSPARGHKQVSSWGESCWESGEARYSEATKAAAKKPTVKRAAAAPTVSELKDKCKALGLPVGGKKANLVERLERAA